MEPTQSGIKTWQWVVTIVVIIALIVIGIYVFGGNKAAPIIDDTTASPTTSVQPGNRIVMTDQFPGNVVYLSSVELTNPGWVAIHRDDSGKPGAVIGSLKFEAGTNPGRITLTQPMVDGGTYYAMIHSEDGDGKFDETKDLPLQDANGQVIMKLFRATTAANTEIKG